MSNLAAVIMKNELLRFQNAKSYTAWIYDKDKPRSGAPERLDERSRYECVDMLGPFKTLDRAVEACMELGIHD